MTIKKSTRARVAERFVEAMPKILVGVPKDYDWGFYSNEDPRMHLQTLGKHLDEYKVWLERDGRRVVEAAGTVPGKILKEVREHIGAQRRKIEHQWVQLMIDKGWIQLDVRGTTATLTAYPGMTHSFKRTINLAEYGGPTTHATARDIKLDRENGALTLDAQKHESKQIFIGLPKVLWVD